MPDLGLLTASELVAHVSAMAEAVAIPLVVDADMGFGNALNGGPKGP
jgi:2-methylisocitrate lyase-like PEP mutase family enzyme